MSFRDCTFLGNTGLARKVSGCTIALTSYQASPVFEDWHAHPNDSISFLLSGTHQEDIFGKTYKRVPGMIKFVPAGEQHRCTSYTPNTRKINLDLSSLLLKQMSITPDQLDDLVTRSPQSKFTLLKLYRELDDPCDHADASAQLLLYELFAPYNSTLFRHGKEPPN